jgi:hypothetical protein
MLPMFPNLCHFTKPPVNSEYNVDGRMVSEYGIGKGLKRSGHGQMEVLSQNRLFGMEGNYENPYNTLGIPADSSAGHIQNTSLEGYGYTRLPWALLI